VPVIMVASREIRNTRSPVSKFLRSTFRQADAVCADVERYLAGRETLRLAGADRTYPWAVVGSAIDYRLRLYFEIPGLLESPAYRGASWGGSGDAGSIFGGPRVTVYPYGPRQSGVMVPQAFADLWERTTSLLEQVRPVHRVLALEGERELCRLCYSLALFDRKVFAVGDGQGSPIRRLPPGAGVDQVLSLATDAIVEDLCQLSMLFAERWAPRLFERSVTFDPHFTYWSMAASADVLIDDCLVDIKTTARGKLDPTWLYQLLMYVLLDAGDQWRVRRAGFYLARQGEFVVWPLERLIALTTGSETLTVERLRETLQSAVLAMRSGRWIER
jgi:hypothetical protein